MHTVRRESVFFFKKIVFIVSRTSGIDKAGARRYILPGTTLLPESCQNSGTIVEFPRFDSPLLLPDMYFGGVA